MDQPNLGSLERVSGKETLQILSIPRIHPQESGFDSGTKKAAAVTLRLENNRKRLFLLGGFPCVFADESRQIAAVAGFGLESIAFLGGLAISLEFGDFGFDFLAVLHVIKIVLHGFLHGFRVFSYSP